MPLIIGVTFISLSPWLVGTDAVTVAPGFPDTITVSVAAISTSIVSEEDISSPVI